MSAAEAATPSRSDPSAGLRQLDRHDWWRWSVVTAVTLLLTVGVFVLSLSALRGDLFEHMRLELAVSGLFAVVLLFDLFAFYQQIQIVRLRRQLSSQIAMMATLELLQPPTTPPEQPKDPSREYQRFHFDQRVTVRAVVGGKEVVIHGWTSDIGDGGVGVVLPDRLPLGAEAMLEMNLGAGIPKLAAKGRLRYRRGFHHGFEFVTLTPSQVETLQGACDGALPFFDVRESPPAARS